MPREGLRSFIEKQEKKKDTPDHHGTAIAWHMRKEVRMRAGA